MSSTFFTRRLILICILFLQACSAIRPARVPSAVELDLEEQAVYASFLQDRQGTVLILQETSTGMPDDDPQRMAEYLRDSLGGLSQETLESYLERNSQPALLSPDLDLGTDYSLLTADELAEISSQSNWGELLAEKHGGYGYLIFSRVGFNHALDQAVLYVGYVAGPLMGSGYYYLLEKQNGEWMKQGEIMIWIS